MSGRGLVLAVCLASMAAGAPARGQFHAGRGGGGHHHRFPPIWLFGFPGYAYGPTIVGPGPLFAPSPVQPFLMPPPPPLLDLGVVPAGLGLGMGAAPPTERANPAPRPAARPRRRDPERAAEVTTFGDRLFRAGNLSKARERYEQAVQATPDVAEPRLRLAQIALRRGRYDEAAEHIREAITAEPDYLANAPDIRVLYPEPADFAKLIAKVEAHLQAHPNDRDAWLVLGAEKYLAGRTKEAADIFLRLTDRKPDEVLSAFLAASNAPAPVR